MTTDIAKQDTLPRFNPDSDILEREDGFHIFMDLPGVSREDLVIDLKENELEITGKATCRQTQGNHEKRRTGTVSAQGGKGQTQENRNPCSVMKKAGS
jgi:HSP20 family molecular chaperone IbpA